jgi:hypothetical protein
VMDRAMALQIVRDRLTTPTGWTTLAAAAEVLAAEVERLDAKAIVGCANEGEHFCAGFKSRSKGD